MNEKIKNVDDRYGWFELNDKNNTLISLPKFTNDFLTIEKTDNVLNLTTVSDGLLAVSKFYYDDKKKLSYNFEDLLKIVKFTSSYIPKYELYIGYKDLIFHKISENLVLNILNVYLYTHFIKTFDSNLILVFRNNESLHLNLESREKVKEVRNEIRKISSFIKKIWNEAKKGGKR